MKKLLLSLITLLAGMHAMASNNVTLEDIKAMDLHISLEEPAIKEPDTLKYYKNFLGERCIDFGNTQTYYNWKRDVTYAGIPIFLSSFIIKSQKKAFRSARHTFEKTFKSEIDNYTQFAPYAAIVGMKAAGYDGRSSWDRFLVSTLASNLVMATIVNGTKYSVKEMRPDNSTRNSFPSGHTATAFTAATILHKEYGLTRSPWFSVGGYAIATSTGIMRVLNNRHWISDVVAGAGIGIMSTELGYFIGDLIYGNKGIKHMEHSSYVDPDHPSFFDIQMGVGMHRGRIEFEFEDYADKDYIELGTSTAVGIETAYFINKYIGFGGMARVTTTPAKGLNLSDEDRDNISEINDALGQYTYFDSKAGEDVPLPGIYSITVNNNNFIDASLDLGVYGNFPLCKSLSLGAKFLAGARLCSGFSYTAKNGDPKVAGTYTLNDGSQGKLYYYIDPEGGEFISSPFLDPEVKQMYNVALKHETEEYDILKVTGHNAFNFVTGVSLTWHYKDNFAWKVFADFDSAKNKYKYQSQMFSDEAMARVNASSFPTEHPDLYNSMQENVKGSASCFMNFFTIGGSFSVQF